MPGGKEMKIIKNKEEDIKIYEHDEIEKILVETEEIPNRGSKKYRTRYKKVFLTFDIETTTIITETYKIDPDESTEKPYAFMYAWNLCIGKNVIHGRTWEDFLHTMDDIRNYYRLTDYIQMVVYVHNLGYEFQFLMSFIQPKKIFARSRRHPLKFCWNGFEFRCSWALSNMKLAKFCEESKNCIHKKADGEVYNYYKLRTPSTPLTDEELYYQYCDVKGLHECIEELLQEDDLSTIPLTSTGYVRRDVRRIMAVNPANHWKFVEMKLDAAQYKLCREVFRGGDVHASRYFGGYVVKNVKSRDIKSAYAFAMMVDYYPNSPFVEYEYNGNQKEFEELLNKYCVIFEVRFWDIKIKDKICDPYIDIAHIQGYRGIVSEHGRLLNAEYISIALTEIDYQIIVDQYHIGMMQPVKCYYAARGKLPHDLRWATWNYFLKKCELDGVDGKEYEYNQVKKKLTSISGMMVTNIVHDQITWEEAEGRGVWNEEENENVQQELDKYYESWNSFLSYQHGIYVTAHTRKRLYDLRKNTSGNNTVYWDTDCNKYITDQETEDKIEKYNQWVKKKNLCAECHGKKLYMGYYGEDGEYQEFKTLGAKKYAYVDDAGNHITIAGLNKEKGKNAIEKNAKEKGIPFLDAFRLGETYYDTGKTMAFFHDELKIHIINVNGEEIVTGSNVAIIESPYTLGVTNEYWEYLLRKK